MKNSRGVGLAAALVACASGEDVTQTSNAILGGTLDATDSAVVTLVQLQSSQATGTCSAVVVSPHVVVTAAHCVSGSGYTYQVLLGSDYNAPTATIDVTEAHPDPAYDGNPQNGHDVGVVILSTPASVTLPVLNTTALSSGTAGKPIRLVGFGLTSYPNGQTTQRRQTTSSVASVDANLIYVADAAHNSCVGDSGGAAFMTFGTTEMLAGIISFGDPSCALNSASVRVDVEAAFIQTYVNQHDPSATDAGADAAPIADASSNDASGGKDAASGSDANASNDGGTTTQGGGGCSMGRTESSGGALAVAAMLLALVTRRRRFV